MTTKNKIIVGVSVAIIIAGAVYLYKKSDKKEGDDTLPPPVIPTPTTPTQTTPTPTQTTPTPTPKATVPVFIAKKNTGLFSSDATKIVRRTTNNDENVGAFAGYKTIDGRVYVMFPDRYNNNTATLALKADTNFKNK